MQRGRKKGEKGIMDLIDRYDAIDEVNKSIGLNAYEKELVKGILRYLPSAQKTGRWIDEGFYSENHNAIAYRCSECGWHCIAYAHELFNYCPSCGARMLKGEEDE